MYQVTIKNVKEYVDLIKNETKSWSNDGFAKPWFRGQSNVDYYLIPSIFRNNNDKKEFEITKKFRLIAPGFAKTPETGRLDQWLFLMQHHELPTRLLDWSESALIALFFATQKSFYGNKNNAAVYAIDPIRLNLLSGMNHFPITWVQNEVLQTIKFAFGTQNEVVTDKYNKPIKYLEYPTAIYPSIIHSRMKSQKGCFTLHGNDKRPIDQILDGSDFLKNKYLFKIIIPNEFSKEIFDDLNNLGISYSTLFQDLDGLAQELKYQFHINDN